MGLTKPLKGKARMLIDWTLNASTIAAIIGGIYSAGKLVGSIKTELKMTRESVDAVGKVISNLTAGLNEVRVGLGLKHIDHD